jgi:hypothetical protein
MGQKLRGLVGQGMDGRKFYRDALFDLVGIVDVTSGSGSIIAPRSCVALIYAFGPGASGSGQNGGGGGGSALFKRLRLIQGQTINYTVGTPGAQNAGSGFDATDTTIAPPFGVVLTAGGGKTNIGAAGGLAGAASGGDINRSGGAGGAATLAGLPGTGGGVGGAGGGVSAGGGGGGGAGFSDIGPGLSGGAGSAGNLGATAAGGAYGGGSGGSQSGGTSGAGGPGRVAIWLLRAHN